MIVFPARPRSRATLHLTPLIDIVFLLLIYFLLTSNFITEEGVAIRLPQSDMQTETSEQRIVIKIDQQGDFFLEDRKINEEELLLFLTSALPKMSGKDVMIKADRDVRYDRVVAVMSIARIAQAEQLHLAIEPK